MTGPAAPLLGRTAVVTGAAGGIGRATARLLAERGAAVALVDRADPGGVRDEIVAAGGEALALEVDVAREADVVEAFARIAGWRGGLDIAVNCAGVLREQPLLETPAEGFDAVIAVNLRGTYLTGREAIRLMRRDGPRAPGSGRVINIASDLAHLGRAEYDAYCASKAAVIALARCWALEFAPDILVNAVAPGPVDTPMLGVGSMSPEWIAKESDIPLGRVGQPEEIAGVIGFLAGPDASFVTGQTFGANGGSVMP